MLNLFLNKSIRFKLICNFVLIILISILTLSIWGSRKYSQFSEQQADLYSLQMINQVSTNVDLYIKHLKDVMAYVSQNPEVVQFFALSKKEQFTVQNQTAVKERLKQYVKRNPEIAGILLLNHHDLFVSNEMHSINRDSLTLESWYKHAVDSPDEVQLISNPIGRNIATNQTYSVNDVLSMVQAVREPSTGEVLGTILLDVRLDVIKTLMEKSQLGQNGFIYILGKNGDIVYSPVNDIVYRIQNEWLQNQEKGSITEAIRGREYRILYNISPEYKWKFIGVFPHDDYLRVVLDIQYYTIIVALLTIFFAIVASSYFTDSIIRPVSKLMKLMKKVEEGDLRPRFTSKYSDEIGQLGNSFNHMVEKIDHLIQLVYTEQKKKREAELQVLQAQIKPHFLYNTLDTIQWMAQEYKAKDIVEMVGALTNLFRIGLNRGNEFISVQDEIKHAESYMIIQMTRYSGKLDFEVEIPQEVKQYQVLKLILQPLIENAIYHGIKARRGKGKISVSARKLEHAILFRVVDDGAGIPPDRLVEINQILQGEEVRTDHDGYGLFNVNERIKLTYGSDYGLYVTSVLGEGTCIEVLHPLQEIPLLARRGE